VSKFIEYFGIDVEDELEESTGLLNHPPTKICTKWALSRWEMDGQLLELLVVVHMTMKPVQVVQIKRKNQLLDLWTWFPTTLQRIEALCTHILRGWCWTNYMSSICLNMNITTIAMRGSMHWMAKSMTSMICSTHSRIEMILRMTECGGCLGSCIASLCLWFFSLSSVCFSWLFFISVGWLYKLYASVFYFQFLLVVFPSSINEMKCNACYLYAFVLFDESKGGEKLETLENG